MKRINSVCWVLLPFLTLCAANIAFPQITNTKITFSSDRDGGTFEIYVMNADGSNQTRLTSNSVVNDYPRWSPDGTKIAFSSGRDGNREIYVMNADGTSQTRLTNNPAHDFHPAWSPDGTKIAFASRRDGLYSEIYMMNADGTDQTRLTNSPGEDIYPSWSSDGTKIVFVSSRDGSPETANSLEIYVMNADGSNQTRLTTNSAEDTDPRWSPDGTRIAFASSRDGNIEIYIMNADGTNQTRLTLSPPKDSYLSWSPDGTKIAFASDRDGGTLEIYVMNADGTNQTRLTNNPADDQTPDWSPFLSITVSIDIKPGSDPNSINPRSKGVIPVAILTTQSFDAATVDPLSVKFGPNQATESHSRGHIEDVDADGDMDLLLHFQIQATGIQCGHTQARLTGKTFSGQTITGTDAIQTVGCVSGKVLSQGEPGIQESYPAIQNYPNPFNPSTTIEFSLSRPSYTTLRVYDILGKELVTLVDKNLSTGIYRVQWNAAGFASGVYVYRLNAEGLTIIKKLVLLQ